MECFESVMVSFKKSKRVEVELLTKIRCPAQGTQGSIFLKDMPYFKLNVNYIHYFLHPLQKGKNHYLLNYSPYS